MKNPIIFRVHAKINDNYYTFVQSLIDQDQWEPIFNDYKPYFSEIETSSLTRSILIKNKSKSTILFQNGWLSFQSLFNNKNEQITAFAKVLELIADDILVCQIKTPNDLLPKNFTSLGTWIF
jgi:hypothetical protein